MSKFVFENFYKKTKMLIFGVKSFAFMNLEKNLVEETIKNNFDIGEIISICSLESGHQSDNVRISTDRGEYVVKYLPQDSDSLKETLILQDILFSHGVKLPKPVKTITGDLLVELSQNETIVVQSFIPGEAIADRFKNPEKMFSLMPWFGKHLGEFHYKSKSINELEIRQRITREEFYDSTLGNQWVKEQYSKSDMILPPHEKNERILSEFEIYLKEINEVYKNNLTKGIIHTDIKPGDFFAKNEKLTGILDFNGAYYSYIMNELGTWVMYTSLYKEENKSYFQDFIEAYLEVSEIPLEELKFLSTFLKSRFFVQYFYFAFRIHNDITRGLDEGETNMDGFKDAIRFVESSININSNYFYNLALDII